MVRTPSNPLRPGNCNLTSTPVASTEPFAHIFERGRAWIEGSGDVLGREFYVMERLDGTVYERVTPEEFAAAPERVTAMSRNLVEQLAAIHLVDPARVGLGFLGDGHGFLDRELEHWAKEM